MRSSNADAVTVSESAPDADTEGAVTDISSSKAESAADDTQSIESAEEDSVPETDDQGRAVESFAA